MIKYFGFKNQHHYTIKQIRIDYTKKTYELGHFIWLSKNETITRKAFYEKIEELKLFGFKEIKKD